MSLFETIDSRAILPTRATQGSAGYDLYSLDPVKLYSLEGPMILRTGIKVNIPVGYCGQLWCRSKWGSKGALVHDFATTPDGDILHGRLIDSDYTNEVGVIMSNIGLDTLTFKAGEKIAQMVIVPFYSEEDVNVLRTGGFGSTDALTVSLPEPKAAL